MPGTEKVKHTKTRRLRVKKRREGARGGLEIASEPSFNWRKGNLSKGISAEEILLQQMYNRALEGDFRDLKIIIEADEENQQVIARVQASRPPRTLPYECNNALEACLILNILVYDHKAFDHYMLRMKGPSLPVEIHRQVKLTEWARYSQPLPHYNVHRTIEATPSNYDEFRKRSYELIHRDVSRDASDRMDDADLMLKLRERRELGGKFVPGLSGNSRGRAGARPEFDLPFPWLEELITVQVKGQFHEMTRTEALILHVQRRALRNTDLGRKLSILLAKARKRAFRVTGPSGMRGGWDVNTDAKIPEIAYDLMQFYGHFSQRAQKSLRLETWLVENALNRLDRQLDAYEQKVVLMATRRPYRDFWPDWWIDRPDPGRVIERPVPKIHPMSGVIIRV